jgi:hypothetical protein
MKNIFSIAILLSLGNFASLAQTGQYFQMSELKNFEGTWIGSTNTKDSVIIELKLIKQPLKDKDFIDCLIGKYSYYKNSVLIYNSQESLRAGGFYKKSPTVILSFHFVDELKNKSGQLIWELSTLQSQEAKWILKNGEVIIINGLVNGKPWDNGFSVPTEIVLKKIK